MSQNKPPRKWTISEPVGADYQIKKIMVIEYSAYEKLTKQLEIARKALSEDTGKTINPDNAMEMYYQMTLRHAQALTQIKKIEEE